VAHQGQAPDATYSAAKRRADTLVKELAQCSQVTALTAGQAADAMTALELLRGFHRDTGHSISLKRAVADYVEVARRLNGHTMSEATEGYMANVVSVKRKDLANAVEEFIQADEPRTKAADGRRRNCHRNTHGLRPKPKPKSGLPSRASQGCERYSTWQDSSRMKALTFDERFSVVALAQEPGGIGQILRRLDPWMLREADRLAAQDLDFHDKHHHPNHLGRLQVPDPWPHLLKANIPAEIKHVCHAAQSQIMAFCHLGTIAGNYTEPTSYPTVSCGLGMATLPRLIPRDRRARPSAV
jgi:hypothetical protein